MERVRFIMLSRLLMVRKLVYYTNLNKTLYPNNGRRQAKVPFFYSFKVVALSILSDEYNLFTFET